MDKRTREALEGSINKWQAIVAGTEYDQGSYNCPLCHLFNHHASDPTCVGCPVATATGMVGCDGTPYETFCEHSTNGYARSPSAKRVARAELDFLISLRPADNKSESKSESAT